MLLSSLIEGFKTLSEEQKQKALFMACEAAVETWEKYAKTGNLSYTDSVVGLDHKIDSTLPRRALEKINQKINGEIPEGIKELINEYREPVTAMDDGDISFSEAVTYSLLSVYNLLRLIFEEGVNIDHSVILNQAISAQYKTNLMGEIDQKTLKWWNRVMKSDIIK